MILTLSVLFVSKPTHLPYATHCDIEMKKCSVPATHQGYCLESLQKKCVSNIFEKYLLQLSLVTLGEFMITAVASLVFYLLMSC